MRGCHSPSVVNNMKSLLSDGFLFFLHHVGTQEGTIDGLPYTSLGYANGPGGSLTSLSFATDGVRRNLTGVETSNMNQCHICSSVMNDLIIMDTNTTTII